MVNKAEKAVHELNAMDELAAGNSPLHTLHPLPKLLLTVAFIFITVSFDKYALTALLPMLLFVLFGYSVAGVAVRDCFRKLKIVMPLVCAVGILNPFFDRATALRLGGIPVSFGVISMLTLMLKGVLCLMASFLLAATTRIEEICHALRLLHVPKFLTSLLLLTFRYLSVLLDEVALMTDAYHLRAPGQKGVQFSAWGSFLGQLLLRSMDRSEALYESMTLRGFNGEFPYCVREYHKGGALTLLVVLALMIGVRMTDLPTLLGGLFL